MVSSLLSGRGRFAFDCNAPACSLLKSVLSSTLVDDVLVPWLDLSIEKILIDCEGADKLTINCAMCDRYQDDINNSKINKISSFQFSTQIDKDLEVRSINLFLCKEWF